MENIHQVGKDCAVSAETQGGGRELQFQNASPLRCHRELTPATTGWPNS